MYDKILNKYKIVRSCGKGKVVAEYNHDKYIIETVAKDKQSNTLSYTTKNLSGISHQNISNLIIDEDDENFYFIQKEYDGVEILENKGLDYADLIKCYMQIISAISYIHQKDLYHGNINPKNILVDYENNVYLLDFGRGYLYSILKNERNEIFYAPERISENEICQESDIYSFGLCMIKLIVDNFEDFDFCETYKSPNDLENLFYKISNEYNLENIENELFLLSRKMLAINPKDRISLIDIQAKFKELLSQYKKIRTFEIKLWDKILDVYMQNNDLDDIYNLDSHIEARINNKNPFWKFDERNDKKEIKIAIGDLVFCCSADEENKNTNLFCFNIIENNQKLIDEIYADGIETYDKFVINFKYGKTNQDCDDIRDLKYELEQSFKKRQYLNKSLEIDKKSIKSEEELLQAEYETIQEKKNVKFAILKSKNKSQDELVFEILSKENNKDSEISEFEKVIETHANPKDNKPKSEKDFKQGQNIIIEQNSISFNGIVSGYKPDIKSLTVKLDKYGSNINFNDNEEYKISYDYQVEEIIWNKKDKALRDLQSANVVIPDLLRKVNNPKEFIKNNLVDIINFHNSLLDENQKLAVQKSMSLGENCERLLIQGPPGTGKTTTITEIVNQVLSTKKHDKILVSSQSNQAVDNVLEKICTTEDKILRIGNDSGKMSEAAKKYRPEVILNKLIKENLLRIKKYPITHSNPKIQSELKNLQDDFAKRLQSISSKTANKKEGKEKELAALFTRDIRLIFGTLIGISSWNSFREIKFDIAIVDEAGRATLSELLVPCIKAKKIILVGDHKQLAPVIDDDIIEKIDDKDEAKTSFFQRLFERLEQTDRENFKHTLTHNYRSERKICELYSNAFYNGELIVDEEINKQKQHKFRFFKSSVVWLDTGNLENREDEQKGTGKINRCSVEYIRRTLYKLCEQIKEQNLDYSIGVITPYKAQKELLEQEIKPKDFDDFKIDIGTVDSFQGSDRDIIVYDCVRSSKGKRGAKIDFIADEKRLNVSLSRAKKLLIIIGDMKFLFRAGTKENSNPFMDIIQYINSNKSEYQIIKLGTNNQ